MTPIELKRRLLELGVDSRHYNLDGGIPAALEGYNISREGKLWIVQYYERGRWFVVSKHDSESAACEDLFKELDDPYYRGQGTLPNP